MNTHRYPQALLRLNSGGNLHISERKLLYPITLQDTFGNNKRGERERERVENLERELFLETKNLSNFALEKHVIHKIILSYTKWGILEKDCRNN